MRKNLEMLDKIYNLRYKSGKVHLFYSINKLVGRFGNVVSLDKIYVSKEYLSYLSEKLFQDKNRIISFFGGNNKEKSGRKSFPEVYPKVSRKNERLFHIYS